MKVVRFSDLHFIPASHEDPKNPNNIKKVLLTRDDLPPGRIQMINWAKLLKDKSFKAHYHEKMVEVFIIISGRVKAKVDEDVAILEKGDSIVVLEKQVHTFENISDEDVDYLAMGIVTSEGGKTVTV